MQFREQKGSLHDSLATMIEVDDRSSLVKHCQKLLAELDVQFDPSDLAVSEYDPGPDHRIGWERTCIVTISGYGPIGYTDSLC